MIPWEAAGGLAAAAGALACGAYAPNCALFGPVTGRGRRDTNRVYLTFDDGPNPVATARILDTLAADGVPAAFFQVGRHVRRFPGLARQVAAAGHVIGNHTDQHVKLHLHGPRFTRDALQAAHRTLVEVTGVAPRSFRAPHGYRNPFVNRAARELGYQVFGWSYGVWDTALPGSEIIRARVRKGLRPGAVILLHDGDGYDPDGDRTQTAAALPGIVRDVRDAGYEFAPLSELIAT
jgi:peptidoglycan/xylan/chitin deacetylase (PgdA/CDA1 family)